MTLSGGPWDSRSSRIGSGRPTPTSILENRPWRAAASFRDCAECPSWYGAIPRPVRRSDGRLRGATITGAKVRLGCGLALGLLRLCSGLTMEHLRLLLRVLEGLGRLKIDTRVAARVFRACPRRDGCRLHRRVARLRQWQWSSRPLMAGTPEVVSPWGEWVRRWDRRSNTSGFFPFKSGLGRLLTLNNYVSGLVVPSGDRAHKLFKVLPMGTSIPSWCLFGCRRRCLIHCPWKRKDRTNFCDCYGCD